MRVIVLNLNGRALTLFDVGVEMVMEDEDVVLDKHVDVDLVRENVDVDVDTASAASIKHVQRIGTS